MIIFLRLRKSPQTPKKKSVKETPKYLKASIGIVYFYAMWLCYPRGNLLYRWSSLLRSTRPCRLPNEAKVSVADITLSEAKVVDLILI